MRSRSISIYAESEEDYNIQYNEIRRRKRLSQDDIYNNINEEDDNSTLTGFSPQSPQSSLSLVIGNNSYNGDIDDNQSNNDDDFILQVEEHENTIKKEEGIEVLCEFLHKTLKSSSNVSSKLLFKNKTNLPSVMSQNAIYSIDTNQIISSLLSACELSSNNDEKKYERIILMIISNSSTEKNRMLSNLVYESNSSIEKIPPRYFDIINYHMTLFNKNLMLEFFNTDETFHSLSNKMAEVYYTLSHCYLFIIDSSLKNATKFILETYNRISLYSMSKTLVLIDINANTGIKGAKIKNKIKAISEGYGMIYLSMYSNEFSIQNKIIQNLFTLIFIKKINTKAKGSKDNADDNANNSYSSPKNKQSKSNSSNSTNDSIPKNVHYSLGFNASYRINHFTAFDFNDTPPLKKRFNEI